MSQSVFSTINPNTTSGNQLATYLNDFKDALMSNLSGTTRPTQLTAGGTWIDLTNDPSWSFKLWNGTVDIILFTINTTLGTASAPGADGTFTVTKISADTVSPILELLKSRVINNGQVLSGDYVGTIQFKGNASDLSVPITARIRAIATNNYTGTTQGTDIVFETTSAGAAAIAEIMRIKDGKLGIGTSAPSQTLHVVGTGIRSERIVTDTNPAQVIARKKKATGTGATLTGETFAQYEFNSTDEAGNEVLAAKILALANEQHSTTAQGTALAIYTKDLTTTAFVEKLRIGDKIEAKENTTLSKYLALQQQVDSATTGSAQSVTPTKSFIVLSNVSLVSINNIANPIDGRLLILKNSTGANISLLNDSGGTAANRIVTGTGADLLILNNATVWVAYDANSSRWTVVGGSGGGSAAVGASLSLAGGGTVTITTTDSVQVIRVQGASASVTLSTTPFGSTAPLNGTYVELIGNDDTNTVVIPFNDAAKGCVGNFTSIELAKYQVASFRYNTTLDRWVLCSRV